MQLNEILTFLVSILSVCFNGFIGWIVHRDANERKANAQASLEEEKSRSATESRIQDSLKFSQGLNAKLLEENEALRQRNVALSEQNSSLKDESHQKEMSYICSRCDIIDCDDRYPPLPWMKQMMQSKDDGKVSEDA